MSDIIKYKVMCMIKKDMPFRDICKQLNLTKGELFNLIKEYNIYSAWDTITDLDKLHIIIENPDFASMTWDYIEEYYNISRSKLKNLFKLHNITSKTEIKRNDTKERIMYLLKYTTLSYYEIEEEIDVKYSYISKINLSHNIRLHKIFCEKTIGIVLYYILKKKTYNEIIDATDVSMYNIVQIKNTFGLTDGLISNIDINHIIRLYKNKVPAKKIALYYNIPIKVVKILFKIFKEYPDDNIEKSLMNEKVLRLLRNKKLSIKDISNMTNIEIAKIYSLNNRYRIRR